VGVADPKDGHRALSDSGSPALVGVVRSWFDGGRSLLRVKQSQVA
jgi:hypothetical protein